MGKKLKSNNIVIKNKKAYFDYAFIEQYIAGIKLQGSEIKSIREGKASIIDTFCYIQDNQVIMKNSYIAKFDKATSFNNVDEHRDRILLLNKKEIKDLAKEVQVPGNTIIPLKMFINEHNLCKVEIALCKGKKEYDKRETIKERDNKREIEKALKNY